ncbi:MAG TPA: transporter [Ohtaekwangia sp.]|uniref:transporter n=1 Tax=Ohtaekwangia sp. TaxID=2066019 RepID=UPI002F943A64
MKQFIFFLLLFLAALWANAQTEKPELVTDRPDQTEAPVLVPKGALQVETGFIYEHDKESNVDLTNFTYNTTLIKYGVNDHLELRFINEYLGSRVRVGEKPMTSTQGFSPLAVGVKLKIADAKGFWPQAAFIGHINLRSGSKEYEPNYTAADFRFTLSHELSDRFELSYNLGAEWNGETPEAAFLYTLALGYDISDRVGAFVEGYSFFPEGEQADNRVDAGITVLITDVVQWDLSAGLGLSDNSPDSFISTGASFRLFK